MGFPMLQDNIATVQARINEALAKRTEPKITGDTVTILAVTKNHPASVITDTLACGLPLASDRPSADQQGQTCGGTF